MIQSPDVSNYNDLNALQSLKAESNKSSREGIRQVAEQFESLFISMMLKSMREANKGFSEGNILSSNETEFYQEMFDSQIAVSLSGASSGGVGLAKVIERQILESRGMLESESALRHEPMQLSDYQRKQFPRIDIAALEKAVDEIDTTLPGLGQADLTALDDSHRDRAKETERSLNNHSPAQFASATDFIQQLAPIAQKVQQDTGISARLMLAQSALETGWGQRPILKEDGSNSFNLFGIKANNGWQGERADIVTTEFVQGQPIKVRDAFRAYASFEESFADYAHFLQNNPRYQNAMDLRDQPVEFAKALQKSGYATDPAYASKLTNIMHGRLNELALFNVGESDRAVSETDTFEVAR